MPTLRGWLTAVAGLMTITAGRLLGVRELYEVGIAGILLVAFTTLHVRSGSSSLAASRSFSDSRPFRGRPIRVFVSLKNNSRSRTKKLVFEDQLSPGLSGHAFATVPPLGPNRGIRLEYMLVAARRGKFRVGPGAVLDRDPFGLAKATSGFIPRSQIVIYPAIEDLGHTGLRRPAAHGLAAAHTPSPAGDEFFTIREWSHGDELRKVHWRSTARLGRLMIRQEERHHKPAVTIIVDDLRSRHGGPSGEDSFERSLSSAASLLELLRKQRAAVRLRFSSQGSSPSPQSRPEGLGYEEHFEALATAATSSAEGDWNGSLDRGVTIAVTTTLEADFLSQLDHRELLIVLHPLHTFLDLSSDQAAAAERLLDVGLDQARRAGMKVVVAPRGVSLAAAWHSSLLDLAAAR